MGSASPFSRGFIYFGEKSSFFPLSSKTGPGKEDFLGWKEPHILWVDVVFLFAFFLPLLGKGGGVGYPPRYSG